MALPSLDNPADKGQVQEIVADIATAVFKSAKVSLESAAKMVVPSVPEMVDDVLEDLKSGSIQKFNLAMDKLDKLVNKLGIDLKQYNKELANFAARREEKIIKSEEKIQTLKEKNIIAEIEKTGDIKILSNREIEARKDNLDILENNIKKLEKTLEKDRKIVQETNKLNTTAQSNKKEEIKQNAVKLEEMKKTRDTEKEVLGERGEQQPGIIQRVSGGMDTVADYLPDQLVEIGSAFKEGLMAPFTAIQDLSMQFGQLLKPLKLLRPLFGGLLKSLKLFAAGLKASIVGFLPFLAIAGLVVLALGGLYLMLKKAQEFFGKDDKTGLEDYGESIGGKTPVADENDFGSKQQRVAIVDQQTKQIIQPDDPRYDEIYERDRGVPAPVQGQTYMGDGKIAILPTDKDGVMNPMELRNMEAEGFKLKPNPLLKPEETTSGANNTVVDNKQTAITTNNNTYTGTGLNGARNNDVEAFALANKMVSA